MMFSVARQRSKSRHSQAFPGSLRAAFLIAAAGLTAVFPPASGACAQTDQAAHAQAAQTPSGQIPQHDMNSSMPASAGETTVPSDGAAKPSAPASEPGHAAPASLPHNLSPWGMFLAADIIVKIVMTGLACASFVTWTVALAKGIELLLAKRALRIGLAKLAAAQTLSAAAGTLTDQHGRIAQFVAAAFAEAERSTGLPADGTKERAAALLTRLEQRAGRAMTRGTGALATIGATAPFVGLFGTVWGIMNSFIGISKANTTNLAVVAPGIAEALLATALGLVAAIPAVVIYNLFARSITSYKALLADASTEVMRHLSRDLDRQLFVPEHDARVVMMRRGAE